MASGFGTDCSLIGKKEVNMVGKMAPGHPGSCFPLQRPASTRAHPGCCLILSAAGSESVYASWPGGYASHLFQLESDPAIACQQPPLGMDLLGKPSTEPWEESDGGRAQVRDVGTG